jgi:predicted O-methyltransferase YrrM
MSVVQDVKLGSLLARLHAESDRQTAAIEAFFASGGSVRSDEEVKAFRSDKLVALDSDKAEFCYQLCRANDARRIVEVGTSYGVSTLYLAAAVRDNIRATEGEGKVIGTEYEPSKARAARAHFAEAGLSDFIELREGDLRQTLKQLEGPIDFVLVDIWNFVARPALELVAPSLRPGAIVIGDNTERSRREYAPYLAFLNDPANRFRTMTLPFEGGLEMSVHCS